MTQHEPINTFNKLIFIEGLTAEELEDYEYMLDKTEVWYDVGVLPADEYFTMKAKYESKIAHTEMTKRILSGEFNHDNH